MLRKKFKQRTDNNENYESIYKFEMYCGIQCMKILEYFIWFMQTS